MHVIHEGIDTHLARPNPEVSFEVWDTNRLLSSTITLQLNLERLRGFDVFMRALPIIQRKFPDVC